MSEERPVLILGESGLLGGSLIEELRGRQRPFLAPALAELDLARAGMLESYLDDARPAALLNATGFTDVDAAEKPRNRDTVVLLNREAPRRMGVACARLRIPLVHVSTDFVFDGAKGEPYDEDDTVAPLQFYGRSKLEGERAVLAACPAAIVVRTATLYGPGRPERPHYVRSVLRQVRPGARIELVRLPVASVTYSADLARAMLRLLEVGARGIVHFANRGSCSRMELAREAIRLRHPDLPVEIAERPGSSTGPARPAYSVLDVSLYERLASERVRHWKAALAAYVERGDAEGER